MARQTNPKLLADFFNKIGLLRPGSRQQQIQRCPLCPRKRKCNMQSRPNQLNSKRCGPNMVSRSDANTRHRVRTVRRGKRCTASVNGTK
jgi:hypothetical protein